METTMRHADVAASTVRPDSDAATMAAMMSNTGVAGMSAATTTATRMRGVTAHPAAATSATTTAVMTGKRRCRKQRSAGDCRRVHNRSRQSAHGCPSVHG